VAVFPTNSRHLKSRYPYKNRKSCHSHKNRNSKTEIPNPRHSRKNRNSKTEIPNPRHSRAGGNLAR
ncbi:hypothetical protein, partial [Neisseria bergeri]|uniref:hypothetical protein n=1 Tax=Neisseria bergeri TaxID=1906581 RepID=UPI0027E00E83